MQDTRAQLTVFTGQQAQPRLITQTHGAIRPNLLDSFDITPKISVKRIQEFDNLVDALIYYTYDGATGKMGFMASNQGQIEALLMDLDPSVATQMVNPTSLKPFNGFMNLRGQDHLFKESVIFYGAMASGNPLTMTPKDAAKTSIDFECVNAMRFPGLACLYTRARGATTQVAAPAAVVLTNHNTGGFLKGGTVLYVQTTAVTAKGETTVGPESAIDIPVGTDTNRVSVTLPAVAGPITSYNVYASDRSNGERFSVNDNTVSVDVTVIPSISALQPPTINTSGVFNAGATDKVFASVGAVWNIVFDKAAFKHPQTGLYYVVICKNGQVVATVDNPATDGTFLISSDGTTFTVDTDPAADAWDIFTLYQP